MFFNMANKMDSSAVKKKMPQPIYPAMESPTLIIYDKYNIDKIHAQYVMPMYQKSYIPTGVVEKEVIHKLTYGIAEEILKHHKEEIQKEEYDPDTDSVLYSLDLYVCKPKKKEGGI